MKSASRRALDDLRQREHELFEGRISADSLATVADELYSVSRVLVAQPRLRRLLGDPATAPEARAGLAEQIFGSQLGRQSLGLLKDAVGLRWSSPWDLVDSLERAADDAVFRAAEKDGKLDSIEDELFRLERILNSRGDVVALLDEQGQDPQRRVALLDSLVAGKVAPLTLILLHNAVTTTRKRSVLLAIDDLLENASRWQERSIARVVSAVELSSEQIERITTTFSQLYGRPIVARVAVDPAVLGGLIVRVGDEVIDGSVAARLAVARAALTS